MMKEKKMYVELYFLLIYFGLNIFHNVFTYLFTLFILLLLYFFSFHFLSSLCIKEPLPSIQVISYQKFTFI